VIAGSLGLALRPIGCNSVADVISAARLTVGTIRKQIESGAGCPGIAADVPMAPWILGKFLHVCAAPIAGGIFWSGHQYA
jgi:hypothetical protein